MLRDVSAGSYRFIPGISAFSSGVVADSGWEIVHATLAAPVPWRDGFARIDRHLREAGRPRAALCGIDIWSRSFLQNPCHRHLVVRAGA